MEPVSRVSAETRCREEKRRMNLIKSFTVNHNILEKGMYISRIDGDAVTYDIRMKKPNAGDYIPSPAAHTIEHLFATYARNSEFSDSILYVGPMGCRTGFYLLVRDAVSHEQALALTLRSMKYISEFEGEIPGSKPEQCGNYLEHDLPEARKIGRDMAEILENWDVSKMTYRTE